MAGALVGVILQVLGQWVPPSYGVDFLSALIVLVFASMLAAFRFARNTERIELSYQAKIDLASIFGVARTLKSELAGKEKSIEPATARIIEGVTTMLGSEIGLEGSNLQSLKQHHDLASGTMGAIGDLAVKNLLAKCCEYMKTIEEMTLTVLTVAQSTSMKDHGYITSPVKNGIRLSKKRRIRDRRVAEVRFESNSSRNLMIPTVSHVQVFSLSSLIEFKRTLDDINHFFMSLRAFKRLGELGLMFRNEEVEEVERQLRSNVTEPINHKIDDMSASMDALVHEMKAKTMTQSDEGKGE